MTTDIYQIKDELDEIRRLIQGIAVRLEQSIEVSNPDNDEVLGVSQVAKLLGSKTATIYGMVYERRIPFHRPEGSRRLYFLRSEIIEWIRNGRKLTLAELDEKTQQLVSVRVNRGKKIVNGKGGSSRHV